MAALTYTDIKNKLKYQSKANETVLLAQLIQDYNTGYAQFLAKLDRYFTRKQAFANIVANQFIYQTPLDCGRILLATVQVGTNWNPPLKEISSEEDWRAITAYPQTSQWPTHYMILGNKEIGLWPTPSTAVTLGLRLVYQPMGYDLVMEDITSTTSGLTATVVNGSPTVTLSGSLASSLTGFSFQTTGVIDTTFYDVGSNSGTTITLVSPYAGPSAATLAWRCGQVPILPPEFSDVPIHYALWLYFDLQGNAPRANSHKLAFKQMTDEALEIYSSANESNVMTDDGQIDVMNIWRFPPPAAT